MNPLGMPPSMFLVFAVVVLAGSLGAIHYLIVHILLRRPFGDEAVGGGTGTDGGVPPTGAAEWSGETSDGGFGGVSSGPSGTRHGGSGRE